MLASQNENSTLTLLLFYPSRYSIICNHDNPDGGEEGLCIITSSFYIQSSLFAIEFFFEDNVVTGMRHRFCFV